MSKKKKNQPKPTSAGKPAKKKKNAAPTGKTIAENRKARHNYELLEKLECGLVLHGSEVKSLRVGKLSLEEAYVRFQNGELWLVNADISEYRQANLWNHDPKRKRKLLVNKKELDRLGVKATADGLTLVPLRAYFNARGIVKVMVAVARGKKIHDKRQTLKNQEARRQIDRQMKAGGRR
ncbi:SsrA-binding protein SmpB [Mariniblastus fucicola]|uniref:SsrA-binding protein SmpB n=1 Tax=Mariniblastus fucicola TaxID=980251 RepID=UPI0009466372|nr:SsrA-binding protein SmpB [Mariniblastus fucicola]